MNSGTLRFPCGKELQIFERKSWPNRDITYFCHQCQIRDIKEGSEKQFHEASVEHEQNRNKNLVYGADKYNKRNYIESTCNMF